MNEVKYDEIGPWSQIKLEILRDYASAYSKILSAQAKPKLHHSYIDAFAGAGRHRLKSTGEFVLGSPRNAFLVQPRFKEYYFIDLDKNKVAELEEMSRDCPCVHTYEEDCNKVLLEEVFPRVRFEDYRRALCILDPYGLHLSWQVLFTAGEMKSVDIFLNFPVMDINMNVLLKNPDKVRPDQISRMNDFWGDDSWKEIAYVQQPTLFGDQPAKVPTEILVEGFRSRLRKVAGFKHVPPPLAMKNSTNATVYYLFFASHKVVAEDIVQDIFRKHSSN
jgi:three-Cys-motif partner protein